MPRSLSEASQSPKVLVVKSRVVSGGQVDGNERRESVGSAGNAEAKLRRNGRREG